VVVLEAALKRSDPEAVFANLVRVSPSYTEAVVIRKLTSAAGPLFNALNEQRLCNLSGRSIFQYLAAPFDSVVMLICPLGCQTPFDVSFS
jgi:hypothetical protein